MFVNYGDVPDFDDISDPESEFYVDLSDKICMMRYGMVRMMKLKQCMFNRPSLNYFMIELCT